MGDKFVRIDTDHAAACFHALWHSHFLVLVELAKMKQRVGEINDGWKQDLLDNALRDLEALRPIPPEGDPIKAAELQKLISDDARRSACEILGQAFDRIEER